MLSRVHSGLDLLAHWWHRLTTSRYVLHLERENARLLAENRGLWETVWGIRGLPAPPRVQAPAAQPIAAAEAAPVKAVEPVTRRVRSEQLSQQRAAEAEAAIAAQRQVRELNNQLVEELRREQERGEGTEYAVTRPGGDPVKVTPRLAVLEQAEEGDA